MVLGEVEDLALDNNFEVFVDHRGDLATVSGREAFEQRLLIHVEVELSETIGKLEAGNAADLIRLRAKRIADDLDMIEEIASFTANEHPSKPNTIEVEVFYDTGDPLTFEVQE